MSPLRFQGSTGYSIKRIADETLKVSGGYWCVLTPYGAVAARVYWGPRSTHQTGKQARDVASDYANACNAIGGPAPKPAGVF